MPPSPQDDFGAFEGHEHMFFNLQDPFRFLREATESELRRQVPDTVLDALVTRGEPRFLTLGRKYGDAGKLLVTHFGFAVLADLYLTRGDPPVREILAAGLTLLFGNVDRPAESRSRIYLDVHEGALGRFTDETLQERFVAFRLEEYGDGEPEPPPPKKPWWKRWG